MFSFLCFLFFRRRQNIKPYINQFIAGNWSSRSNNEYRVLYFIPITNIQHYQALLNDQFLDIYITSNSSVNVSYDKYNFTLALKDINSHIFGSTRIAPNLVLEIFFFSQHVVEISIADTSKRSISSWIFQRPLPQPTTKDYLTAFFFFGSILVFLCYAFCMKKCCP